MSANSLAAPRRVSAICRGQRSNVERIRPRSLQQPEICTRCSWWGSDPAALLRQHGSKVTAQRLAVLRAVTAQPHISADVVYEVVRADIGTTSRRSVADAGYLIDEAEVIYWGDCPSCHRATEGA